MFILLTFTFGKKHCVHQARKPPNVFAMDLIILVGIAVALLVVIVTLYLLQKKNAAPGESDADSSSNWRLKHWPQNRNQGSCSSSTWRSTARPGGCSASGSNSSKSAQSTAPECSSGSSRRGSWCSSGCRRLWPRGRGSGRWWWGTCAPGSGAGWENGC